MKLETRNIYKSSKDGRWRAYCVDENNNPHTVSYPRILMEEKLGRPLEPNEDVHHKDNDVDNNDISNLEVVLHGIHQKKHSTKYVNTIETCMICGRKFEMTSDEWARFYSDINRTDRRNRVLTCSRSCSGKASSNKYPYIYEIEDRLRYVESLWLK